MVLLLIALALVLAAVHFLPPLLYFVYAKKRWLTQPWNFHFVEKFRPRITIINPTYNEEDFIERKLDDIRLQDYDQKMVETIVVDSASTDKTSQLVENWAELHNYVNVKFVQEGLRNGKLHALKSALEKVKEGCEIIVFTDTDSFWYPTALSRMVRYFSDKSVGSVTCCISYEDTGSSVGENVYRNYYNTLRIAESKRWATPIHNGPFLAIRGSLIDRYGIPDFPGSDDSCFGAFVAFMGYRAIEANDVLVEEPMRGSQFRRKLRRAQHLILNFLYTKKYAKQKGLCTESPFDRTWMFEWWLHIINPSLLFGSLTLLILSMVLTQSLISTGLLTVGFLLLSFRPVRTWVVQQFYLMMALFRNTWTRDTMWGR